MTDDPDDVLGNLPRSRPGRRSEKRAAGAGATGARGPTRSSRPGKRAAADRPAASAVRAAERAEQESSRAAAEPPGARAERESPPRAGVDQAGGDLLGGAVKAAAGLAGAGLRVASGLTREVVRRIRP